jgi:ethanolamine utilization protein EutL
MKGDALRATVLSIRIISKVTPQMAEEFKLSKDQCSLGLLTVDCDDVGYTALDEATKKAQVEVAYAKSFYAGAANANTKLAGEFIGILAGATPAEVHSGLNAAVSFMENDAAFISANDDDSIVYYAHCVSRSGSYLSKIAGVEEGASLAYLIAPPLEAIFALDAAMKAADVSMAEFFAPPSETNFGGGLLSGSQASCMAACEAFSVAVQAIADNPKAY